MSTLDFAGNAVLNVPIHNTDFQPANAQLADAGDPSANVDGSGTPVDFEIDSSVGTTAFIVRSLQVTIRDQGSIDVGRYGNNIDLSAGTGIVVEHRDSVDAVIRTLSAAPIKTNLEWTSYMGGAATLATFGAGANHLLIDVPLGSHGTQGLYLAGGDKLVVVIADDLTDLVEHFFTAIGYAD